MYTDYILVGQGLSGSLLAMELRLLGCKVLVIDDSRPLAASRVAGGIINPVTGKRLVRSWMAEQLIPFAADAYNKLSRKWGVLLLQQCSMLEFHYTQENKDLFIEKTGSEDQYLSVEDNDAAWEPYFRFNYGIGTIDPCYILDIKMLIGKCRTELQADGALLEEILDTSDIEPGANSVNYKGITAKKIIFCDGAGCADNPYFDRLPWSKDKGEALIASIPGLPKTHIFKQGISIMPWGGDLFWVGAAHDWKFTDMEPTLAFRKKIEEQLDYWLKVPYKIVDHLVAQRPANVERKPFVGLHPKYDTIGILNGMGGKGCSTAPYFAAELANHLTNGSAITPAADVSRFERILNK